MITRLYWTNPLSKPPCPASQIKSTDKRTSRLYLSYGTSRFALRPFKIHRAPRRPSTNLGHRPSRLPAIDLDTLRTRRCHPNSCLRIIAITLKRSTSSIFRLVSRIAELGHPSTTILHVGISSILIVRFSFVRSFVRSNLRIGP